MVKGSDDNQDTESGKKTRVGDVQRYKSHSIMKWLLLILFSSTQLENLCFFVKL